MTGRKTPKVAFGVQPRQDYPS